MTVLIISIAIAVMLMVLTVFTLGSQLLEDYRRRFTQDTRFNLRELYLVADPAKLYAIHMLLILLIAILISLVFNNFILGLIAAVILAVLPWIIFNLLKKRRIERIEQQLPDALLLIAGAVKAGLSLIGAIRQVTQDLPVPLSQEFKLILQEQRLGVSLDDSLENISLRVPIQPINLMVSAMRIANETGGGLAETLERASATLRSQHAMEHKIKALTSQGKLQAWVVGLLPILLLIVLTQMEPEAMDKLWTTHMGWGVIIAVILLEFFGVWLIRKIVAIDV
jgi:tight adherence protein B